MTEIHDWRGSPSRVIGDQRAYVAVLTYGRGRLCICDVSDEFSYRDGY